MATYLELQWLGLDATPSENTNSDPATGTLQQTQLETLNEIFAVALADGDGSTQTYAVNTVFSTKYRALAAATEYAIGDLLQRDRMYVYSTQTFTTTWTNITQGTTIQPPADADVLATTAEVVTQHTDQRDVTLPNTDPQTQTRVYLIDINSPAVIATDTGWQ